MSRKHSLIKFSSMVQRCYHDVYQLLVNCTGMVWHFFVQLRCTNIYGKLYQRISLCIIYIIIHDSDCDIIGHRNFNMDSDAESPELRAIRQCGTKLTTALSTDPLGISGVLFSKSFLSNEIREKMLLHITTPTEKANILMDAVIRMIQGTPEMMELFLSLLDNDLSLKDIAKNLRSAYHGKRESSVFWRLNLPYDKKNITTKCL